MPDSPPTWQTVLAPPCGSPFWSPPLPFPPIAASWVQQGIRQAPAPVPVTGTGTTATTASFTPTAGALLVAIANCGNSTGSGGPFTAPVTDSLASSWTLLARANSTTDGSTEVWVLDVGADPAARTVTVTGTGSANAIGVSLCVKVLCGAAPVASQNGATATLSAQNNFSISLTPTTTGSLVVGGLTRHVSSVGLTPNAASSFWQTFSDATNGETYGAWRALDTTPAPGIATTFGYTNGASAQNALVAVEIMPDAAPTGVVPAMVSQSVNASSTPPCTVTIPATQQHSLLVMAIGVQSASVTITAVSDNGGGSNTWVQGAHLFASSGIDIWYSADVPAGITSVTATQSSSVSFSANVSEWSGVATTSPVDTSNHDTHANPNTTGPIAPLINDLVIAAFAANSATARNISIGTEMAKGAVPASFSQSTAYLVAQGTEPIEQQWTTTSGTSTGGVQVAFKAGAAAAGVPQQAATGEGDLGLLALASPTVKVARVTATASLDGLTSRATAAKVAKAGATGATGLEPFATTRKVAPAGPAAPVGLAVPATARKVAVGASEAAALGLAASLTHVDSRPVTATATAGLATSVTATHVGKPATAAALGVVTTLSARHVATPTARPAAGLSGAATAAKLAPATGLGPFGLAGYAIHTPGAHSVSAAAGLGLASLVSVKHVAQPAAAGTLGFGALVATKRATTATIRAALGLTGSAVAGKRQGLAARVPAGLVAVLVYQRGGQGEVIGGPRTAADALGGSLRSADTLGGSAAAADVTGRGGASGDVLGKPSGGSDMGGGVR